eukprot:TRINITY_DN2702_c0_g1_i4.p1 TRINITY_DN2702_c0_g1~~TRINITY_DN2702_c0_g1_i4.p1  ORF type:complete len:266 (+),score=37.33 TRINITY_DN2702_c0_g1_i4:56-853(+)
MRNNHKMQNKPIILLVLLVVTTIYSSPIKVSSQYHSNFGKITPGRTLQESMDGWISKRVIKTSDGSQPNGGFFCYNEKSVGGIESNKYRDSQFSVAFLNEESKPVSEVAVEYVGRQYRYSGYNHSESVLETAVNIMTLQKYKETGGLIAEWNPTKTLEFESLVDEGATAAVLDGDKYFKKVSSTLKLGNKFPKNHVLLLSWKVTNEKGPCNALAFSDLNIKFKIEETPSNKFEVPALVGGGISLLVLIIIIGMAVFYSRKRYDRL